MEGRIFATSRRRSGSMETGWLGLCSMAARGLLAGDCGVGRGWELLTWEQWGMPYGRSWKSRESCGGQAAQL